MLAGAQERGLIRELARSLAALHPQTDGQKEQRGLMAGALYALDRAAELGFDDGRATPDRTQLADEFQATLEAIADGRAVPTSWLAGFYYGSALMRLHPLYSKRVWTLPKPHRSTPLSAEEKVRRELALRRRAELAHNLGEVVNPLKHDQVAHLGKSWPLSFGEALEIATDLCGVFEQRSSSPP